MKEADLQQAVIQLAQLCQWRVAHFRPARIGHGTNQRWVTPVAADGAGFPDLVLAHPNVSLLFVELKSEKGRLRPEQKQWIEVLQATGADVRVWRPSDWDEIETTLRDGR